MLLTALVGPFFVDWTAYRQGFEVQAEKLFGHRVKVLGTADARLFPVPSLTFTDVRIGDIEAPLATVSRFEVDIELAPLITGEVRVIDMRLDQPDLDLTLDHDGRLSWFADKGKGRDRMSVNPDDLSIQRLSVQGGRISLDDVASGQKYTLENVNFSLEARSLIGPYKIDGGVLFEGVPLTVQVGTGIYRPDEGLQIKIKANPANLPVEVALDGIAMSDTGKLTYTGSLNAKRIREEDSDTVPVRLEAAFALEPTRFAASDLDVTIGEQDRALRLEGETTLNFGNSPTFFANLVAKQIDLDRALGNGPTDPLGVSEAFREITKLVQSVPSPGMAGELSVAIPGIIVAGGLIENVQFNASTRTKGWSIDSVTATLPGRTGFAAEGLLGLSASTSFSGRLLVRAPQPSILVAWLDPENAKIGRLDPFEIDTNLQIRAESIEVDTFAATLGESLISGSGSWFSNGADKPGSLSLLLSADSIDLGRYLDSPGMANLASRYVVPVAGLDSLIKLSIGRIRIASVDIEGVDINAAFANESLIVDRFFIEDLAGTEVDANGTVENALTVPSGTFDLSVFATDVKGLIQVLDAVAPDSSVIKSLQRKQASLAPLALTGHFEAQAKAGHTEAVLEFDGDVGKTALTNRLIFKGRADKWRDAELDLNSTAQSADGTLLLRQLGFNVLPIAAADNGALAIDLAGTPATGLGGSISLSTGLATATYKGDIAIGADNKVSVKGQTAIETSDLASSLLLVGKMVPILAGRIPVSLEAVTTGSISHLIFENLKGSFADGSITGALDFNAAKAVPKLSGSLSLPSIDFRFLSELALGADAWSAIDGSATAQWPSAAFGPPLLGGLDLDVKVAADNLAWNDTLSITNARFSTRLRNTELSVDALEGGFLGGNVSGAFSIGRTSGEAVLSGRMRLDGAGIEDIIWKRDSRPVATGTLDMAFDFEGSGRSIASVISGLSGGGTATLRKGVLRSMNTGAFDAVMRAADADLELDDAKIQSVFSGHLDSGSLAFDDISGSFTIASGIARARNVSISTDSATAFGGASLDLGRWSVESDWAVKVDPGANAVAGADPEVGLVFSGPLGSPVRKLDTAPLLAFLTLRAFEQEVQRVEALQAEILERDRLVRELKQRRQEIAAIAAEKRRQAEEVEDGAPQPTPLVPRADPTKPKAEPAKPKTDALKQEPDTQDNDKPNTGSQKTENPKANGAKPGAILPKVTIRTRKRGDAAARKPVAPQSFEDRIRKTLGGDSGADITGSSGLGNARQPLLLTPLAPPVLIERAPGG